ncbi:hypothetical protein [Shewanella psychrotolerans]|uniref:hypothetical protein n=1 Tax=Shewanella psychrotolerans TaxID=2864206 RepID=UPI001C65D31E|nr:hypothetical protein [Shewanella psychrotolerans]QYK02428.1 hypothetical protein K0I62_05605 [Shewanella psychrotolerans]
MSLSNMMDASERARFQAFNADKQQHLDRYHRCKLKLDSLNRDAVRQWLAKLPEDERQKCRVVLNNIVSQRREKRGKVA